MSSRVRRISVVAAGIAVLGAVITGTALADDNEDDCGPDYDHGNYSLPTYNGHRDNDREYDSDDVEDCNGFRGENEDDTDIADNGYNGYNGTDDSRRNDDAFQFGSLGR